MDEQSMEVDLEVVIEKLLERQTEFEKIIVAALSEMQRIQGEFITAVSAQLADATKTLAELMDLKMKSYKFDPEGKTN